MDYLAFRNIHKGETALLVGNGTNLSLTPPFLFNYPAFGMNTIHKYEGWKPKYYTGVDNRLMREFGKDIAEKYKDIYKFIPSGLKDWQGEKFVIFNHLAKDLQDGWKPETLQDGITYHNVMHVAMQLAYWMGFTTLLMIGVHHKPDNGQSHFWGKDTGMPNQVPLRDWVNGYKTLVTGMKERGVTVLNISERTYLAEDVIPRGKWKDWT